MQKKFCQLGIIVLLSLGAVAWPSPALGQADVSFFLTGVNVKAFPAVQLNLRAVNGSNQVVNGLSNTDLAVFENGQPVKNFQLQPANTGAMQIIFVLDLGVYSSYQYAPGVADLQQAFTTLVNGGYFKDGVDTVEVLGRIYTSSDQTVELLPATQKGVDLTKWAQAFDYKGGSGQTNGLLGVDDAIKKLSAVPAPGSQTMAVIYVGRRIENLPSNVTVGAATGYGQKAKDAHIVLYAFHTGGAGESDGALSALANVSGGTYTRLARGSVAATVGGVYQAIAAQRALYTLTYRSSLASPDTREVKVAPKGAAADSAQAASITYQVAIKSPQVTITTPADGTTIKRETDSGSQAVPVTAQVAWTDGYTRTIQSAKLIVNNLTVATAGAPDAEGRFVFSWDISQITASGAQASATPLEVSLTDELGLEATAAVTVKVEVAAVAVPTATPAANPCEANPSDPACSQPWWKSPVVWVAGGVGLLLIVLAAALGVALAVRGMQKAPSAAGGASAEVGGTETMVLESNRPQVALGQIKILQGPPDMVGRLIDISRTTTALGRAAQMVDIVFYAEDDRSVISRRHCTVECDGATFSITDHSANGTSVNGQRLARDVPTALDDGDEVMLGGVADQMGVKFIFSNLIGKTQVWSSSAYPVGKAPDMGGTRVKPDFAPSSRGPSGGGKAPAAAAAGARSMRLIIGVLIAALVLVLVCGVLGIGWLILSGRTPLYNPQPPTATFSPPPATQAVSAASPSPVSSNTPLPATRTPAPSATPKLAVVVELSPTATSRPALALCASDKPAVRAGSAVYNALTVDISAYACGNNQACVTATFANSGSKEYVLQVDKSSGAGKAALLQGNGFDFVMAAEPTQDAVFVSVPASTPSLGVCLKFDGPAAEAKALIFQWVVEGSTSGSSVQVPLKAP